MGLCDRLFLGHFSLEALEGCVSGVALCSLFQQPCMRVTSTAQVFVGQYQGSGRSERIGSCIWQMIWFSLLSMLITLPLGWWAGSTFFQGTAAEAEGSLYFHVLMSVNFLFPLGTALSSFFIGQGRLKIVVIASLISQVLNIFLDYFLIFGIPHVLAPQGIFGAALATCIAQGSSCLILFVFFMRENGALDRSLKRKEFWYSMKIGIPRALSRISITGCWACIAHIMMTKGEMHLLVLSIGSVIVTALLFINEGMAQAMITIASNLLGLKAWSQLWKLVRSACLFVALSLLVLSVPLLFYPHLFLPYFFKELPTPDKMDVLSYMCGWLWVVFLANGMSMTAFSLITATKDTVFHMLTNALTWVTTLPIIYWGIGRWDWPAESFWIILAFEPIFLSSILFLRLQRGKWKTEGVTALEIS
jgi:MATE family multidrug resistance protein